MVREVTRKQVHPSQNGGLLVERRELENHDHPHSRLSTQMPILERKLTPQLLPWLPFAMIRARDVLVARLSKSLRTMLPGKHRIERRELG
jgi:hypothetical protein